MKARIGRCVSCKKQTVIYKTLW